MAVSTKRLKFNDGEGLDFNDLDNLQKLMLIAAWDDRFFPLIADETDAASDYTQGYVNGPNSIVTGTIGLSGGVQVGLGGTRTVTVQAGNVMMTATQNGPAGVSPDTTQLIRVARFDETSFALAANASGSDRFDIIQCSIDETDTDTESRDVKDAITGLLTTQTVAKRHRYTATLTVKQGTPAAGVPAADTGKSRLAACKVPNGATNVLFSDVIDYSRPMSRGTIRLAQFGSDGLSPSGDFVSSLPNNNTEVGFTDAGASTAFIRFFPPGALRGDGMVRVFGVILDYHALLAPTSVQLFRNTAGTQSEGGDVLIESFTHGLTLDDVQRVKLYTPAEPIWCNGYKSGRSAMLRSSPPMSSLGFKIATTGSGANNLSISSIRWVVAI